MAKVKFTTAFENFFPETRDLELEGDSVEKVLRSLYRKVPGISQYVVSKDGSLLSHVNIHLKDDLISDRKNLSDKVDKKDELFIFQTLSGVND